MTAGQLALDFSAHDAAVAAARKRAESLAIWRRIETRAAAGGYAERSADILANARRELAQLEGAEHG